MANATKGKVVVTGGAGFIGSHLVRALLAQGYEVHVVDNYVGGRFPERYSAEATYHEGSVLDTELLQKVFKDVRYVFHLAALPRVQYSIENPRESHEVNVTGTLAVLIAARDAGAEKVVYSASSSAYGNQEQMPLVEDMPVQPLSPYALHKYIGEQYMTLFAELYGMKTVSLRYFNVYGPNADPYGPYALVVARFILQRKEGQPITIAGDGTNSRDYTHVSDVVRANILAAESDKVGAGEVLNIGGGKEWTVTQIAELVGGETVHIDPRIEPRRSLANTSKAKKLLGWEPTIPFEEGVAELKKEAGI